MRLAGPPFSARRPRGALCGVPCPLMLPIERRMRYSREKTMTDRALLVSWYDLPGDGRDAYLAWLHGKYIPKLLATPGVLGASHYEVDQNEKPLPHLRHTDDATLPTGNSYILSLSGDEAHVFLRLSH